MISTMFLNNLSVVDHAYITEHGDVRGGSFQPSFLVKGEMDPVEKVVVDFSTIKKQMKAAIDDKLIGFDHKLWVINGFSTADIFINDLPVNDFSLLLDHTTYDELTAVTIETPSTRLTLPKNAIKFVQPQSPFEALYTTSNVGKWFQAFLNEWFEGRVEFECFNTIEAHTTLDQTTNPLGLFTYAHGLRDSTSWGCQNIAHGHLSFIQLLTDAPADVQREVLQIITADLDGTIFIYDDNVVSKTADLVEIEYTTGRGRFAGSYDTAGKHIPNTIITASPAKVVVLKTETTVEYLVEYICNTNRSLLQSIGVTGIFVSEGLSKGAYVTV